MPVVPNEELGAFPRIEGDLVQGKGRFVENFRFADEAYGYLLRSPHPHARIRSVDTTRAATADRILAVLTGADLAGAITPLPCAIPPSWYGGKTRKGADRAVLATDRVRHVGDGVAFVVAEDPRHAAAAAKLIDVDYEPLPYRSDIESAQLVVPIWDDVPDDVCFDWRFGDAEACRRLFATAAHVVRIGLRIPRVCPYALEPRVAVGFYDRDAELMTLFSNTQGPHFVRNTLARAFNRSPKSLRVITPNVGGGFGSKIYAYPEHALVLHAARLLDRPVRWTATRSEAFLSDTQARGHLTQAALALDDDLRFLALSVHPTVDLGAYLSQLTPVVATGVGAPVQGGAYRFEAIEIAVRGVFTNKVPVDAFRGAGRPEATYVLERLIDRAALELGVDPAELRARNMASPQRTPIKAVTGLQISGQFLDNQTKCLEAADRDGFASRRAESARRGVLRGFGFACYLEANGGLQTAEAVRTGSFPSKAPH